MLNVLKTDLIRIFKDKLFLILLIIGAGFSLFTPVLTRLILFVGEIDPSEAAALELFSFNAKSMFFNSFSPGNNFGLIAPILVSIILCKDFSHGTIRNKIICGKRRGGIFFSLFVSCTVATFAAILTHALLTLGVSLLLFDYQADPFTFADFGHLLLSLLFEVTVYAYVSAIISFLCVWSKNTGVTIVCYVAIAFLCSIAMGISSSALLFTNPENTFAVKAWTFVSKINPFGSTLIGSGRSYTGEDVLYILLPSIVFGALFYLSGLTVFRKKDLK